MATHTQKTANSMKTTMTSLVSCKKCKRKVKQQRETILCCNCNGTFEFDCAGISEKLYLLMRTERKKKWKCIQCSQAKKKYKTPSKVTKNCSDKNINNVPAIFSVQMTPEENQSLSSSDLINSTPIKADNDNVSNLILNVTTQNSFESLSQTLDESDEGDTFVSMKSKQNRSCPEIKINYRQELQEMEERNSLLHNKLQSADKQIEDLLLENSALRKQVSEQKVAIENLKQICNSTRSPKTSSAQKKRKTLKRDTEINTEQKSQDNIQSTTIMKDTHTQDKIVFNTNTTEKMVLVVIKLTII